MRVLVTAGSTNIPIDRVRVLSNIFKGKTGLNIAGYFAKKGDEVTLLTSGEVPVAPAVIMEQVVNYRDYDELEKAMKLLLSFGRADPSKKFDVVIHSAAVSDYRVTSVHTMEHGQLMKVDSSGKIPSGHDELFLKMVPTEKLIDKIRKPWGFEGVLVKFKLQVEMSDEELLKVARKSMKHSKADLIVANCLEWMSSRAFVLDVKNEDRDVLRKQLPAVLFEAVRYRE